MKLLLTCIPVLFIFFINPAFSQKEDFTWFFGRETLGNNNEILTVSFLNFLDPSPEIEIVQYHREDLFPRDGGGRSILSDSEGNLLFYTDGFDVFNKNHKVMENGYQLAYKGVREEYYHWGGGVHVPDYSVILPQPDSDSLYYIIYLSLFRDEVDYHTPRSFDVMFSIVDLKEKDGLGKVVTKDSTLLKGDFTTKSIVPIRHANGRDWWIPVKHFLDPVWYVFLLDPEGLRLHRTVGMEDFQEFYARLVLYNYSTDQFVFLSGDHYYPYTFNTDRPIEHNFHVFDFDRCTGAFAFNRTFDISILGTKFYAKTLAIEPNGRYLYGSTDDNLFQFDLHAEDVQSTMDTVIKIGVPEWAERALYEPKFIPNGELWLSLWAKNRRIGIIKNPELPSDQVNIVEEPMEVTQLIQGTFPNSANYRFGPIDGSPCDTLGIDNLPVAWFRYNDMNLEQYERRFTDISYFRPEDWTWDFDDGTTFEGREPGVHEFPGKGEYYVCLTVSNENAEDTYCEWVTIDGPSSVEEELKERGYSFFPNPSGGNITFQLSQRVSTPSELRVYDLRGALLRIFQLDAGLDRFDIDLRGLVSGMYMVEWNSGKEVIVERVVME
nr:T9SS type A sorting domain-containing protein [Saprospiraceae bacterium]